MQSKIESDLSAVSSNIGSLRKVIETIDETIENTPDKIKEAELALKLAKQKVEEKRASLEELKAGADALDIKVQQNAVVQKEKALARAEEALTGCFVRAPFDGTVAKVNIKKGDVLSANTVIATLITEQLVAEITLNEIDVTEIKTGQKANITFDALEDLAVSGQVAEVDTLGTVSQGVVTYAVKIVFDMQDERIKPGMSLSAAVITSVKQNTLLISSSAIKQQGDVSYVQVVGETGLEDKLAAANISGVAISSSSLRLQEVQVGLSNDTMTEVLGGLQEGEAVVIQTISSSAAQSQFQRDSGFSPGMIRMMR